jgi:hypothetical protein
LKGIKKKKEVKNDLLSNMLLFLDSNQGHPD